MKAYEEVVKETNNKVTIHELINFDKKPENPVKVSIVIPVCNVEQYLRECLDSAVNCQTAHCGRRKLHFDFGASASPTAQSCG